MTQMVANDKTCYDEVWLVAKMTRTSRRVGTPATRNLPRSALLNSNRKTSTTPPRRMLSYPLNISYARPIVLSCTALHGGHQTMKWGV